VREPQTGRKRLSAAMNNDNAAVELSPAMENLRIDRENVGDHLHISSTSAEENEDEEKINLFLLFVIRNTR
jgi:hypothetical protein